MSFKDHFSSKAAVYAKARPTYPPALFSALAGLAPGRTLAWDCGAGNGQASLGLAAHFERVVATEPSAAQLAEAAPHPRVTYLPGAELAPSLAPGSVDLVTAAQAAHWFDREKFYGEVRRVLRPGGAVALWTYALCQVTPEIDALVDRFYSEIVGPYWPPERRHTESGYREFAFPALAMEHEWTLDEFVTYLRTWSAVTRYTQALGVDPVTPLQRQLVQAWGSPRRLIRWPLRGRVGTV
ncbi:MAG: class I SAM-dependent methyltransferase [Opitutaceae bacterium]|nr:class I SAM-dependent methyltransferase [Opitutaceae bacterium]